MKIKAQHGLLRLALLRLREQMFCGLVAHVMPSLLKGAFRGLLSFFSRPLIRGGYKSGIHIIHSSFPFPSVRSSKYTGYFK
jgi:hypothetical protein